MQFMPFSFFFLKIKNRKCLPPASITQAFWFGVSWKRSKHFRVSSLKPILSTHWM